MIEIKNGVKALIFDVDGTLVDSMPMHFQAWIKVIEQYGIKYTKELFYSTAGKSTQKIVEILNKKFKLSIDPQQVALEKEREFLKNVKKLKPILEVAKLVENNAGKFAYAAGTGGQRKLVEIELEVTGLDKYFPVVVTAEDVINHKPEPDTFLKCADSIGVAPEYCQVFEDAALGLEAAKRAGMIATDITPFYTESENKYPALI